MPTIRYAAAIIITRNNGSEKQVFLVRRNPALRFMGGYWAFPGGTVIPEDQHGSADDQELTFLHCALRELFEETGILLGAMDTTLNPPQRQRLRQQLLDATASDAWVKTLHVAPPDYHRLELVANLITPPFSQIVYDTRFFHLVLDDGIEPAMVNGELVDSGFYAPADAVRLWQRGELDLAPPVLFLLRLLAGADFEEFKAQIASQTRKFRAGALIPIYFVPGIFMTPLTTPTLPPATTTNTYIVGQDRLYLVDPATPDQTEQQRLFAVMDEMLAAGKRFEAILLTHHHADHVGAVTAVSQRYQLRLRAHPLTYQRLAGGYLPGPPLHDGERLDLGPAPDGVKDWQLLVIHTPGHAVDHLCFLESRYQSALVGDMLSTVSTIIIDPPEGHMRTYLNSLARLRGLPIKTVFPAHGPAQQDGLRLIGKLLEHRQERENKIIQALGVNVQGIDELLPRVYDDVAPSVYPVAARSLLAGLIKLEEDGVCRRHPQGWLLT